MQRFARKLFRSMLLAAVVAGGHSFVRHAEAGGTACACEEFLSKLDPATIPKELRVADRAGELIAAVDNGNRPITALAFLKYGKILAVAEGGPSRKGGGPAGRVRLYDLSGKSPRHVETLDVTNDYVAALAAHPSRPNLLVAASVRWDQRLQTWKHAGMKWGRRSGTGRFSDWWVKTAAVSPDGKTLATGAGGVRLWSLKDGALQHEQTLPGTTWAISAVAYSPDGKQLVAVSGSGHLDPRDGQLLVWSMAGTSPKVIARASVAQADVTAITVRQHGRIITADQTGKLVFWTLGKSGALKRGIEFRAHAGGVRSLQAIIGDRLISTGNDGTVALWNAKTGRLLKRWEFRVRAAIATVAPSGRHVAVGLSDGRVYLLRLSK